MISAPEVSDGLSPQVALEQQWARLLADLLPNIGRNSFWRYSRGRSAKDATCGWKIHISATIIDACSVLRAIGPSLVRENALFKAPSTLSRLMTLNSGIVFGYSQVGKFITIFPKSESDFLTLLRILEPRLKRWPNSPVVPFDLRVGNSCIYYRYGTFVHETSTIPAIHETAPMMEDTRDQKMLEYAIANDPLRSRHPETDRTAATSFPARYIICDALSQRGKGGVYSAIDLGTSPPRQCVIKEGRLNGEISWRGRDGRWRIRNEAAVLSRLLAATPVPEIYDSFECSGNYYLVLEKIEGTRLDLLRREGLTALECLDLARQICAVIEAVHKSGWIWRDCKPQNFVVDPTGLLRPIDFEGACAIDSPDLEEWSTLTYPKNSSKSSETYESSAFLDLYQLGSCLSWILETETSSDRRANVLSESLRDALSAIKDPELAKAWNASALLELLNAELSRLS